MKTQTEKELEENGYVSLNENTPTISERIKNLSNVFWFYNKQEDSSFVFGSITAITQHTTLKKDKLYYHFTRLKKSVYEDDMYYIKKTNVIRSSTSNNKP